MSHVAAGPRNPAAAPPARRRASVRRTATTLMTWPDGFGGGLHLEGRARDLATGSDGAPTTLETVMLHTVAAMDRTIQRIAGAPQVDGLERLVGRKGGSNLRAAITEGLPDQVERGSPLYLLLDDLAGCTLIAGFAFFRWADRIPEFQERRQRAPRRVMSGICAGFRPGATTLLADGTQSAVPHNVAVVPPLVDANDPLGWHDVGEHPEIAMRRARRIDVWADGDNLGIDAMFRDSCWDPDGTEIAVHEYQLLGVADRASGVLTSIEAQPRVLPYLECPAAAANAAWMVGTPLREFRVRVLESIRGTDCCTHLNDALRSLAEVPVLADSLPT
jgi:hypothetical protein